MLTLVTQRASNLSESKTQHIRLRTLWLEGVIGSYVERAYSLTRAGFAKEYKREREFVSLVEILGSREEVCDSEDCLTGKNEGENERKFEY